MNVITTLIRELGTADLHLRKAQPRGPGRLSMELASADGRISAGQWHTDLAETQRVAALLRCRFGEDSVALLSGRHLLVQHHGADRKLPALRHVLSGDGAVLVAHRPERRAVVRVSATRYVKVVRPGRTADVVAPLLLVCPDTLRIPEVVTVDDRRGLVFVDAVPGRTLLEHLGDPHADDEQLVDSVKQVGASIRRLHAQTPNLSRPVHDGAVDVTAAQRWLAGATEHGLLRPGTWERVLDRVAARVPVPPTRLANLLTHLDLRFRQGHCNARRAARCSAALLEGYSPDPALVRRLAPYVAITRLRLAGLYSFRPAPEGLVAGLMRDAEGAGAPWV